MDIDLNARIALEMLKVRLRNHPGVDERCVLMTLCKIAGAMDEGELADIAITFMAEELCQITEDKSVIRALTDRMGQLYDQAGSDSPKP